jgi:hypothetical protein
LPRRDLEDLARLLADKAAGDEGVLEKLSPECDIPDEVLGFPAQQAVEKLIKPHDGSCLRDALHPRLHHLRRHLRDPAQHHRQDAGL